MYLKTLCTMHYRIGSPDAFSLGDSIRESRGKDTLLFSKSNGKLVGRATHGGAGRAGRTAAANVGSHARSGGPQRGGSSGGHARLCFRSGGGDELDRGGRGSEKEEAVAAGWKVEEEVAL